MAALLCPVAADGGKMAPDTPRSAARPGYTASSCDYTVDLTSQAFDERAEFERLLTNARNRRQIGGKPFIDFQLRRFGGE